FFRRWSRLVRWRNIDGYAFGLSIGLAFGRVGCYAVGEHFGRQSDFFLASRYDGGSVREPLLGDVRLVEGMTFHQTALYELLYLLVLFAGLAAAMWLRRRQGRELVPGTVVGVFVLYYGVARWLSDSLRVNDERVAGMTGAQWMALALIPAGLWILLRVRPQLATLVRAEAEDGAGAGTGEGEDGAEMDAEPHADDAPGAKSEAETDSEAGTGAGAEAGTEAETEDRAGSGTENGTGAGAGEGSESGVEDGAEVGTDAGAEAGAEASAEAETEGTSEPEASGSPADDAVRAV